MGQILLSVQFLCRSEVYLIKYDFHQFSGWQVLDLFTCPLSRLTKSADNRHIIAPTGIDVPQVGQEIGQLHLPILMQEPVLDLHL